jgi:hypothetical protein
LLGSTPDSPVRTLIVNLDLAMHRRIFGANSGHRSNGTVRRHEGKACPAAPEVPILGGSTKIGEEIV